MAWHAVYQCNSAEGQLAPLLLILTGVLKGSPALAAHCKSVIFRKYSSAPATSEPVANK
jgi:hypothetical protein